MYTAQEILNDIREISGCPKFLETKLLTYVNQVIKEIAGRVLLPGLDTRSPRSTDTARSYIKLPDDYHRNLRLCHSNTHNSAIKVYKSRQLLERWYSDLSTSGRVDGVAVQGDYLYYQHKPSAQTSLCASTISFNKTTSAIGDTASGLGVFSIGDTLTVSGSPSASNDGTYTVTAVNSAGTSLSISETLSYTQTASPTASPAVTLSTGERLLLHYHKIPDTMVEASTASCLPKHIADDILISGSIVKLGARMQNEPLAKNIDMQYFYSLYESSLDNLTMFIGPEAKPPEAAEQEIDWNSIF